MLATHSLILPDPLPYLPPACITSTAGVSARSVNYWGRADVFDRQRTRRQRQIAGDFR